jgi:hypothetical protein
LGANDARGDRIRAHHAFLPASTRKLRAPRAGRSRWRADLRTI